MEITTGTHARNLALGFVPDLLIAWIASRLTDSEWTGFFVTILVLQLAYFFWAKQAAWSWLVFWFYGKDKMSDHLQSFFRENDFPSPSALTGDLDDYFVEIAGNEGAPIATRVKASFEHGTLNGLKTGQRYSLVLQVLSAGRVALKRYAARTPPKASEAPSGGASLAMGKDDLETVAWLADYGFRVWTYPVEDRMRPGEQLSYSRAQRIASLLDKFEREIVPNLLAESEDEKEQRFTSHENRMKHLWDCYPQSA